MPLTLTDYSADTEARVDHLTTNLTEIVNHINGATFLTTPFTAAMHTDLSGTLTTMHSGQAIKGTLAAMVTMFGTGVSHDTALVSLGTACGFVTGSVPTYYPVRYFDSKYDWSTKANCDITVPINAAPRGVKVTFGATFRTYQPGAGALQGATMLGFGATVVDKGLGAASLPTAATPTGTGNKYDLFATNACVGATDIWTDAARTITISVADGWVAGQANMIGFGTTVATANNWCRGFSLLVEII